MEQIKKEKNKELFFQFFWYFTIFSIIGLIIETLYCYFTTGVIESRKGLLWGPFCPVYGVGALSFIFILGKCLKNKTIKQKILLVPLIFLGCMTIATLIELATSYICEWTMGYWPWQTYVDYEYNFQGRIALSPSIRFGLGGTAFLYILQPLFEKITKIMGSKVVRYVAATVGIIFLSDVVYTFFIK